MRKPAVPCPGCTSFFVSLYFSYYTEIITEKIGFFVFFFFTFSSIYHTFLQDLMLVSCRYILTKKDADFLRNLHLHIIIRYLRTLPVLFQQNLPQRQIPQHRIPHLPEVLLPL